MATSSAGKPNVRPVVWQPPTPTPRAKQSTSSVRMPDVTVVSVPGAGPEDVLFDDAGRILAGLNDGQIIRVDTATKDIEVVANTNSRPLGLEWLPDGGLLICDAHRGLLRADVATGAVTELVRAVDGIDMVFCNNADVATDGTIYFTDSSRKFPIEYYKGDLIEHSGGGRLLRRNTDGTVDTLLDGLQFSNGVALAPDESWVVVAETGSYRLTKLWLTGERAGQHQVIVDNLPGFPDNISTGSDGLIWVALPSPRDSVLDRLHKLPPSFRRAVWSMPESMQPGPKKTIWVQAYDADGNEVYDFQQPGDELNTITGVREENGRVAMGSLTATALGWFDLPQA
jgi:sugar lactone lactonase YvrE